MSTDPIPVRFRNTEACEPQPFMLWDTVWIQEPVTLLTAQGGFGDWDIGVYDEPGNMGGLRAKAALHTATLILLFTDLRAPDDMDLPDTTDPRGWWGDSVLFETDPTDRPLGSLLWTLERGTLSEETELIAQEMCERALDVLREQGLVALTEVDVEALPPEGQLRIAVRHFSHNGTKVYDQKFEWIWGQTIRFPEGQTLTRPRAPSVVGAPVFPVAVLTGAGAYIVDPGGAAIEVQ